MPIPHGLGGQTLAATEVSGVKYLQVVLTSFDGEPYSSSSPASVTAIAVTGMLPAGSHTIGALTQGGPFSVAISSHPGSLNLANNQVSLSGVANQIVSSRSSRRKVTIENYGYTDVYLGASGVTTSNGFLLKGIPGAGYPFCTQASIWGVTASGVQSVGYVEEYD